jgi:hypothetical protein
MLPSSQIIKISPTKNTFKLKKKYKEKIYKLRKLLKKYSLLAYLGIFCKTLLNLLMLQ